MKPKDTPTVETWSWLMFSLHLGCVLGLFLATYDLSGRLAEERLDLPFILPVLLVPPLVLLAGILGDRFRNRGLLAALSGICCWALLLFNIYFSIPYGLATPLFVLLFSITLVLYQSTLVEFSLKGQKLVAGRAVAFMLLPPLGLLLIDLFNADSAVATNAAIVVAFILGLVALVPFLSTVYNRPRAAVENVRDTLSREVRAFSSMVGSFSDAVRLFGWCLVFAMGAGMLAASLRLKSVDIATWLHVADLPILVLPLVIWGAFSTRRLIATFGMKRILILASFVLSILALGLSYSQSQLEVTLLAFGFAFAAGSIYAASLLLVSSVAPPGQMGQSIGYFYLALAWGLLAGFGLHDTVIQNFWPLAAVGLFVTGLFVLQSLSPHRAIRLNTPPESTYAVGITDLEWDGYRGPLTGLARHTFFSRVAQMLARTLAEIFFGNLRVVGRENLNPGGPAIFVANHPNTFIDPLLVTAIVPGRLHYWAKSTLWKLPVVGAVLDRLGAIPVFRKQDTHGPTNQRSESNRSTFEVAVTKLNRCAHILIFPEGVSQVGLSLKPIKTGAMRLGFQALEESDWETDIPIVPIGIDYAEPSLFRGHVTIRIGEPVYLAAYRGAHASDPRTCVVQVTETVTGRLKNLLPHLDEPELENLVQRIQNLYGERVLQILDEDDETSARKAIAEAVNHYQRMDPDTVFLFNERINTYCLEEVRLATPENHPPIPMRDIFKLLADVFSLASFGLVTNWLPYRLTGRLVEWFTSSPVWRASAKLLFGSVIFILYYGLLWMLLRAVTSPLVASILILAVAISAFVALGSLDRFAFRFRQLKNIWQVFWTQDTNDDLEAMKVSLIQDLERFRESYAFYRSKETW